MIDNGDFVKILDLYELDQKLTITNMHENLKLRRPSVNHHSKNNFLSFYAKLFKFVLNWIFLFGHYHITRLLL